MTTTHSMYPDLCEVVFPYEGINKDELTLRVGQVVTILTREVEDAGWWKGEVDGAVGVFPENFVRLIEKDNSGKKPERPPALTNTSENVDRKTEEEVNNLNASLLSGEENYNLTSGKKELCEASSSSNKIQEEKRTPKIIPTINVTNINEKEKENEKSSTKEVFDEIISNKLTLTTAGRVKAPKRRPPSQHFLKENIPEESDANINDEDEGAHDVEQNKPPVMKMLDISQVKLRESKKPTQTNPGGKPSWLEELSKKQTNRQSMGYTGDTRNKEQFSRSKSEYNADGGEPRNTGLSSTFTPQLSTTTTVTSQLSTTTTVTSKLSTSTTPPTTATFREEVSNNLGWDRRILDVDRMEKENVNNEDKTVTEISNLKVMISQFQNDMQDQLSKLKTEIGKEREARALLEKEVRILRNKCRL
eukprot:GFUD01092586.1.p1 GENE.GFUD01092586.1~~GFUD01092586.1.p1  ORF type:complete len:418 (+),score=157.80 GFUD01092586.1:144-1397(+)